MIKIGNKKIATNVFLAPLAGCSDLAFRLISREAGAKFCFFEMVDSNSLVRGPHKKTISILKTSKEDAPIAGQILGSGPDFMLDAAKRMLDLADISFLDINAACPVKKAIRKKAGSYLLKDAGMLCRIIETLASNLSVPVTVKIRTGYEGSGREHIVDLAKRCESSGASALFVHGRTREQFYGGMVDYESIKAIKDGVNIPVLGSGDVFDASTAKAMFEKTGCDGILVARGALGNPWIFAEIEGYLTNGRIPEGPDNAAIKKVLTRHINYIEKHIDCSKRGKVGVMRKAAMWYFRGMPKAAGARRKICLVKGYEEMLKLIDELIK